MPAVVSPRRLLAGVLGDPSSLSLVISNLATLVLALVQHWDLATVMWVYWGQSVIIGFFTFLKILTLPGRPGASEGVAGPASRRPTGATVPLAIFFAVHYGIFHLVYSQFLRMLPADLDRASLVWAAVVFFLNHLFSFVYNWSRDREQAEPGVVFGRPYARILPMHLTILLGFPLAGLVGTSGVVLAFFLVLKTYADLHMHVAEHGGSRPEARTPGRDQRANS